jgi:hypothetical protein
MNEIKFNLDSGFFHPEEKKVIESEELSASLFRYRTGVCGIRFVNSRGSIELLPYQGQQIWRAQFDGRELGMKTAFNEPVNTTDFLKTFGCFMLHCGALRVGAPSPGDNHPLHGELPNAPYQNAWISTGNDKTGSYLSLCGSYDYKEFFGPQYSAKPVVKLRADSSEIEISMKIRNTGNKSMELMYVCHINFQPVIGSRLEYSAEYSPKVVRSRSSIPSHIKPGPGYLELVNALQSDPTLHHNITNELKADPELCFYIDYSADDDGRCFTLQVHPDGNSDFVCHLKKQLPRATRWISITPDHEAMAIVEPGTCETEGYHTEKEKGNIKILGPGEEFICNIRAGKLDAPETSRVLEKIKTLFNR